jgi:hypothetical protein
VHRNTIPLSASNVKFRKFHDMTAMLAGESRESKMVDDAVSHAQSRKNPFMRPRHLTDKSVTGRAGRRICKP